MYIVISPLFYSLCNSFRAMGMIPLPLHVWDRDDRKTERATLPRRSPVTQVRKAAFFLPKSRFTSNIQYTIMPKSAGQEQNSLDRLPAVRELPLRGHGGESFPPKSCSPYGVRGAAPILLRLRKDSDCGVEQEVVAVNDFRVMGISEDSCDFETFQPSDSCEVIRTVV